MRKHIVAFLVASVFFIAFSYNSFAASQSVILNKSQYAVSTGTIYVGAGQNYKWGAYIHPDSSYKIVYYIKKNGGVVDSGTLYPPGSTSSGVEKIYSASTAGNYEVVLDCNGPTVSTGCHGEAFIQNN